MNCRIYITRPMCRPQDRTCCFDLTYFCDDLHSDMSSFSFTIWWELSNKENKFKKKMVPYCDWLYGVYTPPSDKKLGLGIWCEPVAPTKNPRSAENHRSCCSIGHCPLCLSDQVYNQMSSSSLTEHFSEVCICPTSKSSFMFNNNETSCLVCSPPPRKKGKLGLRVGVS